MNNGAPFELARVRQAAERIGCEGDWLAERLALAAFLAAVEQFLSKRAG